MNLLDVVSNFGEQGAGFEKAQHAAQEELRRQQEEKRKQAEFEYLQREHERKQAEAVYEAQTRALQRNIAAKYGLGGTNQMPPQPAVNTPAVPSDTISPDGPGPTGAEPAGRQEGPIAAPERNVAAAPAQADIPGMLRAQRDIGRSRIQDPRVQESMDKAQKTLHDEGYRDFLAGIIGGQDPEMIKRQFNQKGEQKITRIEKSGAAYQVQFEDGTVQKIDKATAEHLGESLKLFAKVDRYAAGPAYATIWDKETGEIKNPSGKHEADVDLLNIRSANKIEEDRFHARYRAMYGAGGSGATARQKDFASLKETFAGMGYTPEEAEKKSLEIAYHITQRGQTPEQRLNMWTRQVRQDPRFAAASTDEVLAQARKYVQMGDAANAKAAAVGVRPAPASTAASTPQDAIVTTPPALQTSYTSPDGKVFRWVDVVSTAKRYNLSTDEVISRRGLVSAETP